MSGQQELIEDINDASFDRDVLRSTTPCVVVLWTPWSQGYATMAPIIERVAAQFSDRVRTVRIDLDQNLMMATHFHVRALPMLLLVENGRIVDRCDGVLDTPALRTFYESILPEPTD